MPAECQNHFFKTRMLILIFQDSPYFCSIFQKSINTLMREQYTFFICSS